MSRRARQQWVRRLALGFAALLTLGAVVAAVLETARFSAAFESISSGAAQTEWLEDEIDGAPLGQSGVVLVVFRFGDNDPALPETAFGLVRLDDSAGKSWLVGIPPDASLDEAGSTLAHACKDGPVELVITVEKACSLSVDQYAEIDMSALARWAGESGGLEVLEEPSDGSAAAVGRALSTPDDIMSYIRVDNGAAMTLERTRRVHAVLRAAVVALHDRTGPANRSSAVEQAASWMVATLTPEGLRTAARILGREAPEDAETASVPVVPAGRGTAVEGEALAAIVRALGEGEALPPTLSEGRTVDPASVSITVHNGAGVEGVATEAAAVLTAAGFPVLSIGNANQFVYDSTLVVYDDDVLAADRVLQELPVGRRVASHGMYLFNTDVLVVVGRDWP